MIMQVTIAPGVVAHSGSLIETAAAGLASFAGKELELMIAG
jgi:hypothetical protein